MLATEPPVETTSKARPVSPWRIWPTAFVYAYYVPVGPPVPTLMLVVPVVQELKSTERLKAAAAINVAILFIVLSSVL